MGSCKTPHSDEVKDVSGFPFVYSEQEFKENDEINVKHLTPMIGEF